MIYIKQLYINNLSYTMEEIIYNGEDKIGYSEEDNKKDSQQIASKEGLKFYGVLN